MQIIEFANVKCGFPECQGLIKCSVTLKENTTRSDGVFVNLYNLRNLRITMCVCAVTMASHSLKPSQMQSNNFFFSP